MISSTQEHSSSSSSSSADNLLVYTHNQRTWQLCRGGLWQRRQRTKPPPCSEAPPSPVPAPLGSPHGPGRPTLYNPHMKTHVLAGSSKHPRGTQQHHAKMPCTRSSCSTVLLLQNHSQQTQTHSVLAESCLPRTVDPVMLGCRLCVCDTLGGRSSSSSKSASGSKTLSGVATEAGGEGCGYPPLRTGVVGGRRTDARAADSPEDMRWWCCAAMRRMKRALEASDWGPSTADPVNVLEFNATCHRGEVTETPRSGCGSKPTNM